MLTEEEIALVIKLFVELEARLYEIGFDFSEEEKTLLDKLKKM